MADRRRPEQIGARKQIFLKCSKQKLTSIVVAPKGSDVKGTDTPQVVRKKN